MFSSTERKAECVKLQIAHDQTQPSPPLNKDWPHKRQAIYDSSKIRNGNITVSRGLHRLDQNYEQLHGPHVDKVATSPLASQGVPKAHGKRL